MRSIPSRGSGQRAIIRTGRRYSRFVGLMRFLLPTIALFLVGLVVLWPQIMGGFSNTIMPMLAGERFSGAEAMLMHKPRYVGETEANEPYEVVAGTAIVDPDAPDRILLDELDARVDRTSSSDVRLLASSGIYHRAARRLELSGTVELTTSDGFRFETSEASIRLDQGRVDGGEPIAGIGPPGTLRADRFQIRKGGDVMRFEGRVKVTTPGTPGPGGSS